MKKINKPTLKIFVLTKPPIADKDKFVSSLTKKVPYSKEIGYAGYSQIDHLNSFLKWSVYGLKQKSWKRIDSLKIKKIVNESFNMCKSVLIDENINIFVFPTIDSFIIDKMNGVGGFTPWKNTIIININPKRGWEKALKHTIAHELAHAISLNFNARTTIRDDLICEGVAEHFRENFVGGGKAKWTKAIPRNQSGKILNKIKKKISKRDEKLYAELFFGTGEYPIWTGYSIGYFIVEDYLKKSKEKNWREILKISSAEIYRKSIQHV